MSMKKIIAILTVVVMVGGSFMGCGESAKQSDGAKETDTDEVSSSKDAGNSSDSSGEEFIIKIAHNQTPDAGYGLGVQKLEELLSEKDSRIKLEVFDNGTMGNERDVFEGNQLGTVDVAITSIGVVSNFAPLVGMINLPFMFKDDATVEKALESESIKTALEQVKSDAQLEPLGIYSQGFRHVVSNKGDIQSLDDFKSLKIRVPESDIYIATFDALGSSPTPIAWGEMYTSMQTGVVDAFENTPVNVVQYKLEEVSKYEIATNHMWDGAVITVNQSFWDGLPSDVQDTFRECIEESALYQREELANAADTAIKTVKDAGMNYSEVSDDFHAQLVEAVQSVYEDYYSKNPEAEELVAALQ